jgi:hypothetical protein
MSKQTWNEKLKVLQYHLYFTFNLLQRSAFIWDPAEKRLIQYEECESSQENMLHTGEIDSQHVQIVAQYQKEQNKTGSAPLITDNASYRLT